jgi:hypothetical protein
MTTFVPSVLGLTAFVESNRIDFILNGPELETPERASIYFEPTSEADVKLQGKKLTILPAERDEDGQLVNPGKLRIKWGRQTLTLGHRANASGPMSFYRSLEDSNASARPKTPEQLFALLEGLPSEHAARLDDEIGF